MILYHDDVNGIGTQEQRPWSYRITRKWVLPDHNIDHGKYYYERTLSPYVKIRNNVPKLHAKYAKDMLMRALRKRGHARTINLMNRSTILGTSLLH